MSAKAKMKLIDLKRNTFVRKELDQDHVLYLAELLQNGVEFNSAILVTKDGRVIDGRHRIEAYELNDRKDIEIEFSDVTDESELISMAYRANVGGSMPPKQEDTQHTVEILLERKESIKRIAELLGLPLGIVRRYVKDVQSRLARAKLLRAISAISEGGLTVTKAAEQYDVDPERLKEAISGSRKKKSVMGIDEIMGILTKNYKTVGLKNANTIRGLMDKYEEGDVTKKQMSRIFGHIEHLQKKSARALRDWKDRFNAKCQEP